MIYIGDNSNNNNNNNDNDNDNDNDNNNNNNISTVFSNGALIGETEINKSTQMMVFEERGKPEYRKKNSQSSG